MFINKIREKFGRNKAVKPKDYLSNILSDTTHYSISEAYKTARTNLMFTLAAEKGCKKIIVTSSQSGEGKSTTTSNLAIAFAQTGARVMVLEADLRRPKLHRYFSLPNDKGMSEFLGGFATMEEVIQHVEKYNVDCITGGKVPPNPSELLISPLFAELLEKLSENYDYIFVDSPPINVVSDPISIAKLMSGAVVVARQNYTTSEVLRQAIASLEFGDIKILGYILNASKDVPGVSKKAYKTRYGYKQYSKYGYYGYSKYGHHSQNDDDE
ncbi:MAG: CpsD/CapB family tyrosine-protein kinase [Clostridia bacterium]|nr:CpsD/CapB family tyrosine-protein kinase [Clostridia bacterium]